MNATKTTIKANPSKCVVCKQSLAKRIYKQTTQGKICLQCPRPSEAQNE